MDKDDVKRLTDALEGFNKIAESFKGGGFNNGIHFDTGGVAVWISVTLVAVLLSVCFSQANTISNMRDDLREMNRKLDRAEDYVNQIYRSQFKPKAETK